MPASPSSPARYPPMPRLSRSPMPTTYSSMIQVSPNSYPPVISSQVTTATDSTPPVYAPSTIGWVSSALVIVIIRDLIIYFVHLH